MPRPPEVSGLRSVVENDSERMPVSCPDFADTMAKGNAIVPTATPDRAAVDCEDHGVSFAERHDGSAGLHARALLCQNEFATRKIASRLGQ